jgi:hypothetical protein
MKKLYKCTIMISTMLLMCGAFLASAQPSNAGVSVVYAGYVPSTMYISVPGNINFPLAVGAATSQDEIIRVQSNQPWQVDVEDVTSWSAGSRWHLHNNAAGSDLVNALTIINMDQDITVPDAGDQPYMIAYGELAPSDPSGEVIHLTLTQEYSEDDDHDPNTEYGMDLLFTAGPLIVS